MKKIGSIDDHFLAADSRQFLLTHPARCKRSNIAFKGTSFHGYWLIEEELANCGLSPNSTVLEAIANVIAEHSRTKCGFLK